MKKLLLLFFSLFLLASCSTTKPTESTNIETSKETTTIPEPITEGNPIVLISLSNGKAIECELYPEIAPISVNNFLSLADSHFYEGTIFHRVIAGFMIQGGGFYIQDRTVYQKSAAMIKGEFEANGVKNDLSHTAGVLSMARATAYDSGSSQFFICVADATYLDKNYAAFGKVTNQESLNVAIEMSTVATGKVGSLSDFPYEPISITSITRVAKEA